MLDEWRPDGKYSGPDGIDMLKCLTNVDTAAAIKGRYSDICFYDNQPRIMTCNTKDVTEWASNLGMVTSADVDAVLRRTVFIEVNKILFPRLSSACISRKGDNMLCTTDNVAARRRP